MKALNPIKLIVLIAICLFPPAVAHRLSAQTVSWTSSDPAVATVDTNGTVTPVSDGTVSITAAVTQNGKTTTSGKTLEVNLAPPSITINGVKWATGNVTYDPSSCTNGVCTALKIADNKYDRGLYFQWFGGPGSNNVIIGYPSNGGTGGDVSSYRWNVTPTAGNTNTYRYVQPGKSYGFPSSWPANNYNWYYNGYGYHSYGYTPSPTEWTGNNPCTAIAGGQWRLPTAKEFESSFNVPTGGITTFPSGWSYSSGDNGGMQHTSGLWLPMVSALLHTNGAYPYYPMYWSSTFVAGTDNKSVTILGLSTSGMHLTVHDKTHGASVRCVLKQ